MGLDMYLFKTPRYKDVPVQTVNDLENIFWSNDIAKANDIVELQIPANITKECVDFFISYYKENGSLFQEVGYWRKANHIHKWFVDHVQNGEDDCDIHEEVTKELLLNLLSTCQKVLKGSYDEHIVGDTQFCEIKKVRTMNEETELLPRTSGFFFGGTAYDEDYYLGIKDTIEIIISIFENTDFEKEAIYYQSSW